MAQIPAGRLFPPASNELARRGAAARRWLESKDCGFIAPPACASAAAKIDLIMRDGKTTVLLRSAISARALWRRAAANDVTRSKAFVYTALVARPPEWGLILWIVGSCVSLHRK